MKLYISPSSQTKNMYSGMAGISEAAVCQDIGRQLYSIVRDSFETCLANPSSNVAGRILESNSFGADLHLCIHTNAASPDVTGTLVMCYRGNENDPVVSAVYRNVASLTPSLKDQGVRANNSLAEVSGTKAKCIYVEVDFHSNSDMAKWIASHTEYIALALAAGLQEGTGINIPAVTAALNGGSSSTSDTMAGQGSAGMGTDAMGSDGMRYLVVAGSFTEEANARRKQEALNGLGIESWIKKEA